MADVSGLLLIVGFLAACFFVMCLIERRRSAAAKADSGSIAGFAGPSSDCSSGGADCGSARTEKRPTGTLRGGARIVPPIRSARAVTASVSVTQK